MRNWIVTLVFLLGTCGLVYSADEALQRAASPREMLDVMQIDESLLRFFVDDLPVDEREQESLLKLLFRLPSFAIADVDRWTQPIADLSSMISNPDSYRFEMYDLRGDVAELKTIEVIPELVSRLGFRMYYQVRLTHDGVDSIVYTRAIPTRWLPIVASGGTIEETIRVQAMLLKRTKVDSKVSLVFAASRLDWRPSQPSIRLDVENDHVLLGQLGVDVSRLDDVVHRSAMGAQDRECFYQMLAAVRMAEPAQLAKLGRQEFDIAQMIQRPNDVSGELYAVRGTARRAIEIKVDDPDIQERFQLTRYFEVEVFVPMERPVRFVDSDEPQRDQGKLFADYPFVLCLPELPSGMEQGDDIRVPVTFSGFFFKLWAYHTNFMSAGSSRTDRKQLQQSPLLIGPSVVPVPPYEPRNTSIGLVLAWSFIAILIVVWFLLWRAGVRDAAQTRRLFRKHSPPDGSFDSLHQRS